MRFGNGNSTSDYHNQVTRRDQLILLTRCAGLDVSYEHIHAQKLHLQMR